MLITEQDFEALSETQMQWKDYNWEAQEDRFNPPATYEFKWAYWYSDYTSVMFARQFLLQSQIAYEQHWDEATQQYMILTDYSLEYAAV